MEKDDFKELEYRDYAKDLPSGQEQLPTLKIPVPARPPSTKPEPAKPKIRLISRLLRGKRKILGGVFAALCLLIIFLPKLIPTGWLADAMEKELTKHFQYPVKISSISLGWFGVNIKRVVFHRSDFPSEPLFSFNIKVTGWLPGMVSRNPKIKEINLRLNDGAGQIEITGDISRFLDKKLTVFNPPLEIKITLKDVSMPFDRLFPEKWPAGLNLASINGVLNLTVKDRQNIYANGEFTAARVVYEDMLFENIVCPLKIDEQQWEIGELKSSFNGGAFNLTGVMFPGENLSTQINITIKMEKVKVFHFFYTEILKFLQPLFPQKEKMELGQIQTVLTANGNLKVLAKNQQYDLSGDGNIIMEHGLIDSSVILKEAFKLLGKPDWARFEFDRMEQSFKIRGNRIYNQGARLTGSKLTLELNGWTAFSGEIEQQLIIRPTKECEKIIIETCNIINESGGIPISGTISRPKINTKEIKKKIAERLKVYLK